MLIFEAGTEKPVVALLRLGKRPSGEEAACVLRHVIRRIRPNWPRVGILLRGNGHYGMPEVMNALADMDFSHVFGLPANARSWRCERHVIACVEARRGVGVETRFIVTNIPGGRAKHLHEKLWRYAQKLVTVVIRRQLEVACRMGRDWRHGAVAGWFSRSMAAFPAL